jgi:hypothetical protein
MLDLFRARVRQALTHKDTLVEAAERGAAKEFLEAARALLKPFNLSRHKLVVCVGCDTAGVVIAREGFLTLWDGSRYRGHLSEILQTLNFLDFEIEANRDILWAVDDEELNPLKVPKILPKARCLVGTSHFTSMQAACRYYAEYGFTKPDVKDKIFRKEIHIGPPDTKEYAPDEEGRYWVPTPTAEDCLEGL